MKNKILTALYGGEFWGEWSSNAGVSQLHDLCWVLFFDLLQKFLNAFLWRKRILSDKIFFQVARFSEKSGRPCNAFLPYRMKFKYTNMNTLVWHINILTWVSVKLSAREGVLFLFSVLLETFPLDAMASSLERTALFPVLSEGTSSSLFLRILEMGLSGGPDRIATPARIILVIISLVKFSLKVR